MTKHAKPRLSWWRRRAQRRAALAAHIERLADHHAARVEGKDCPDCIAQLERRP